jgi:CRISPR/Cas system-associated exonuclease Cas4 (RecB family)
MSQEKSERFKRLASKRTNEVLDKLRILGNCADRRSYHYTDEEIEKIFRAIDEQTKIVKAKFKKPKKGFKF